MRTTTDSIQALYEEHDGEMLPHFGNLINGLREHIDRLNAVCSLIWDLKPETLLDIGCNKGLFGALARWNHGPVQRVVGVDISRLSRRYAKEVMGYDDAYVLNASEPFDLRERFDLVLAMEIIEHVPAPENVVQNVVRHMKDDGFAILSCPVEYGDLDGEFHVRNVNVNQLEDLARHNGLVIRDLSFLPSKFCEKPKWQGWNILVATKGRTV